MLANGTYIHGDDAGQHERDAGKDSIIPIFKRGRRLNQKKSEAEGRAIYDEFDECHFMIPGDQTYLHIEGVNETHKRRFRKQWEDYQAGREQITGEPLDAWYEISGFPGLIDELRAVKCRSVNDLATMHDDFVGRTPGWRDWREKARKYVAAQASKAALAEQNAELLERIAKLEAAAGMATASTEPVEPKRGPGRPPNAAKG